MKRDVPEPWAARMVKVGLVDTRNGRPSMTRLAEAADTHPSTVGAMMYGTRATSSDVIDRVAAALFPDGEQTPRRRREVHGWVGRALDEASPFTPHPDADLLTAAERKAVNEVIRLLALAKKGAAVDGTAPAVAASDDTVDNVYELTTEEQRRTVAAAGAAAEQKKRAAKKGQSRGRAARAKQDREAEAVDQDPDLGV